jgi:hypothetical protein
LATTAAGKATARSSPEIIEEVTFRDEIRHEVMLPDPADTNFRAQLVSGSGERLHHQRSLQASGFGQNFKIG